MSWSRGQGCVKTDTPVFIKSFFKISVIIHWLFNLRLLTGAFVQPNTRVILATSRVL